MKSTQFSANAEDFTNLNGHFMPGAIVPWSGQGRSPNCFAIAPHKQFINGRPAAIDRGRP